MSCNDSCAVDKAEAKEFAYFTGLTRGSQLQRESILATLDEHLQLAYVENHATDGTMHTDHCKLCDELNGLAVAMRLIRGETK